MSPIGPNPERCCELPACCSRCPALRPDARVHERRRALDVLAEIMEGEHYDEHGSRTRAAELYLRALGGEL